MMMWKEASIADTQISEHVFAAIPCKSIHTHWTNQQKGEYSYEVEGKRNAKFLLVYK